MDFYRINDKIISFQKITDKIKKVLDLRSKGLSQAEVAEITNIDRSFISRLESIGEVRKGKNIAVIGFPIKNKEEVERILEQFGIGFYLLMTEKERNDFINSMSAAELLEVFSRYLEKFKMYDVVIAMGSDFRLNWFKAFLDNQVISIPLGKSPLKNDVYVEIDNLKNILSNIVL